MKKTTLDIIHSDDDVIVINKPAGLLAIPDRFDVSLPNVRGLIRAEFGDAFIVHRLDRDTSGVMIIARNAEAHKHLNDQFEHHKTTKLYHVIVSGVVDKDTFPIDIPLAPDPRRKGLMKPSARGKEAHTIVTVLERFRIATLAECSLITGRQHQIRVHCSAVGHPLLVDKDYGKNYEFLLSSIKKRFNLAKNTEERPIIERQTLHARSLSVDHPTSGERVTFTAEYPKDFAALVQILRKYSAPYTSAFETEFF